MITRKYLNLTAFFFCFFTVALQAQKQVVPGYQGKRLMAGLYYSFMSTTSGVNGNGVSVYRDARDAEGSTKPFAFSGRLEANVSYVLSRRFTSTFELGYGRTGLTQRTSIQPTIGQRYTTSSLYRVGYSYAAIGIQMQRKKRWGLAPIGPYWGIRYIIARNNLPKVFFVGLPSDEYVAPENCDCTVTELADESTGETILKNSIYHNFDIQFGIKNIIKQHYFYDLSVSTAPAGYYAFDDDYDTFDTRLKRLLSINLRLGVGLLF